MDNENNISNIKSNKNSFNFLNETYEVMKCFENNPSKLGHKINELKLKFEKARQILASVPGIDMSQSEQQDFYEQLLKQYNREHELLNSYKEMCKFDLTELQQQPDDEIVKKKLEEEAESKSQKLDEINPNSISNTNGAIEIESAFSAASTSSEISNIQETKMV